MTWRSFLLIGAVGLLGLYLIDDAWYLRAAAAAAAIVLLIALARSAAEPRQRLLNQQAEIERLGQLCEELDQNTRLIVQTDLELTRTQEELDKKIGGLYTLHELSQRLIAIQSIPTLLTLITDALVTKLGFEKALIGLTDVAGTALEVHAVLGYSQDEAARFDWAALLAALRPTVYRGQPLLLAAAPEHEARAPSLTTLCGVTSMAVAPIILTDHPVGFVAIGSNPPYDRVTQGDLELLSTLASEAAVAIENIRLYDEIRRSHQELEHRVKERTQELAQANEELRRLNKMKSDFVSAVSHELRTPLTSIKGYASILATGKLGPTTKEQQERLTKIDRHTNYVTSLISDLLDIARIESGRVGMELQAVDINQVLARVTELMAPQFKEKEVALTLEMPPGVPTIPADPRYLERVFINLLSNALKFTPARGTVGIAVARDPDALTIRVRDTGLGIAPQDLPKIFEEFYRADNPINRERKGTGLGLSLVKRIVEAHGGRIWAEGAPGEGATFTLTLPLTRAAGAPMARVI
ncbi:MAG: GAF domain-containing protein [Candidatus Omnitrophica bacterium]|nr:GAF domain-containing protein [Candidatus Omnitrophota bacterium]